MEPSRYITKGYEVVDYTPYTYNPETSKALLMFNWGPLNKVGYAWEDFNPLYEKIPTEKMMSEGYIVAVFKYKNK